LREIGEEALQEVPASNSSHFCGGDLRRINDGVSAVNAIDRRWFIVSLQEKMLSDAPQIARLGAPYRKVINGARLLLSIRETNTNGLRKKEHVRHFTE